nr:hypothetical protein GCM10020093_052620 [Planobispora longispora]
MSTRCRFQETTLPRPVPPADPPVSARRGLPRSARLVDLPVRVDRRLPVPLCAQLADGLRLAMRDGTLKSGERLPSTRALARQLAVSRTVVTEAYQQLYAEGWIEGGTAPARTWPT